MLHSMTRSQRQKELITEWSVATKNTSDIVSLAIQNI